MSVNVLAYKKIAKDLKSKKVQLVAVSKTNSSSDIIELYNAGQRDFGENYVQELIEKHDALKDYDINWHFVGHLQTNKVKLIAPFVNLIQSVDSLKLLQEIDKQAEKSKRTIDCLLQIFISNEETKFGMDANQLTDVINELNFGNLPNINIVGLMGMASLTADANIIKQQFQKLQKLLKKYPQLKTLSMGMSQDYKLGIECGSNMVRIGSLFFGERKKKA